MSEIFWFVTKHLKNLSTFPSTSTIHPHCELCELFPSLILFSCFLHFQLTMCVYSFRLSRGLKTEDNIHCTDCKAHCGNVIVILGYIDKILFVWKLTFATYGQHYAKIPHRGRCVRCRLMGTTLWKLKGTAFCIFTVYVSYYYLISRYKFDIW